MTFGFRTMQAIEGDIRYRFSARGLTVRHTPDDVRQLFNVSWAEYRELVSLNNDGAFLDATDPDDLPTDPAVTGESYAEVDIPVAALGVYGVRVIRPGETNYKPLKRIGFAAIHDFQCPRGRRAPLVYHTRTLPTGAAAAVSGGEVVGKVMIAPVPTGGTYRLWYLKAWEPLVANGDKFGGHMSGIEWSIWHTCIKMMGAEQQKTKFYELCDRERSKIEARIEARALALDSGMSEEPRDARGDGEAFWDHEDEW